MAQNSIFDIQLMSSVSGKALLGVGGRCLVVAAGLTGKSTLLNPDSSMASLANAMTLTRGRARFAITGAPLAQSVDIYGVSPGGHFFQAKGVQPGDPTEIPINTIQRQQTMVIPWLGTDFTSATETASGLILPAGTLVHPNPALQITVGQSGKTLDVGMLSSEIGSGDANGFLETLSLTTAGTYLGKLVSTANLGALLHETSTATEVRKFHIVPAGVAATGGALGYSSISFTFATTQTTCAGYFMVDYTLPAYVAL